MKPVLKITLPLLVLSFVGAPLMRAADDAISAVIPSDPPSDSTGKKGGANKHGEGMLEARLQRLDQALKLTDDQKTKIKDIWATEAKAAKDKGGSADARRTAMKSAHDQVRALLTPDQQAIFDKMPAEGHGGKAAKGKKKSE